MPRHMAINSNFLQGSVYFNNTRNINVMFVDGNGTQMEFTKAPKIILTPTDSATMPAYRQSYVKNGLLFIGVQISMNSLWTGNMDWIAVEGI